jgi:hypothetical protein
MKQSLLNNELLIVCCLGLSVFRIYLEVIRFDFAKLPLTKRMGANMKKYHKYGFYFSVGYFILFAPSFLMS